MRSLEEKQDQMVTEQAAMKNRATTVCFDFEAACPTLKVTLRMIQKVSAMCH